MRYGLSSGAGFVYVLLLPFLALVVWAVMDALFRPGSHWAAADQNTTARGYTPTARVPPG